MSDKEKSAHAFSVDDKALTEESKDELFLKARIVDKVFKFLSNDQISSLTVAITGEWGSGKTSAINLLAKELSKTDKSIVLYFEPLLEGRFEVADILELFYLRLYAALTKKKLSVDSIFKKLLGSLATAIFSGTKLSLSLPAVGDLEIDCGEKYQKILDIWKNNDIKSFQEQTVELNEFLQEEKLKIFVMIDEIDRLSPQNIINFLMFARILETFDNLVCIVGIDYDQVVQSLMASSAYGISGYERAKSYLDKLFHARFHIHHNQNILTSFVSNRLKSIDEHIFSELLTINDYDIRNQMDLIVKYLKTPRQIKKWLTLIIINKALVLYYPGEMLKFLMLSAVCVKHPIVISNIAEHTLPMLNNSQFLPLYIKNIYQNEILFKNNDEKTKNNIILQSTGIKKCESDPLVLGTLKNYIVIDQSAFQFMSEVILTIKISLLSLFVDGYVDDAKVKLHFNYFEDDINDAVRFLIDHYGQVDDQVSDLNEALSTQKNHPKSIVDIHLLNELWQKSEDPGGIFDPYLKIILFSLNNLSLEDVISKSELSLLELHIHNILFLFEIKNKNGKYNIGNFVGISLSISSSEKLVVPNADSEVDKSPVKLSSTFLDVQNKSVSEKICGFQGITFNGIAIEDFTKEDIEFFLEQWIERVESDIENKLNELVEKEKKLLSVFYRYIQWAEAVNIDGKKAVLSSFIVSYLKDDVVSLENKLKLINLIFKVCAQDEVVNSMQNPIFQLFDNNETLISVLKEIASDKNNKIEFYDHFDRCVNFSSN